MCVVERWLAVGGRTFPKLSRQALMPSPLAALALFSSPYPPTIFSDLNRFSLVSGPTARSHQVFHPSPWLTTPPLTRTRLSLPKTVTPPPPLPENAKVVLECLSDCSIPDDCGSRADCALEYLDGFCERKEGISTAKVKNIIKTLFYAVSQTNKPEASEPMHHVNSSAILYHR